MVGLVIVSHSRQLAEAASVLAKGVGQQDLPVFFAGGTGENHAELGTDATDIMDAITRANNGDGVLVLMDLGSAVLSARLAEQMLDGMVDDIRLCPAPLVEGAVAAAVQIAAGAGLDDAYREARNALAAKQAEFEPDDSAGAPPPETETIPADALVYRFTLDDPHGMHARPAAELVKALADTNAEARIRNALSDSPYANARSLNGIALSGIRGGDIAELALWGPDKDDALAAVKKLVADTYHGREVTEPPKAGPATPATDAPPEELRCLAPGVAVGRLVMEDDGIKTTPEQRVDDPEAEVGRFRNAARTVRERLTQRKDSPATTRTEAAILDAQTLLLDDAETLDKTAAAIRERKQPAASAYQSVMRELAGRYRDQPDAYMRERAADIAGLARLVANELLGNAGNDDSGDGVVLWADEISPAQLSQWPRERLRGFLTRRGGTTSHAAILARSLGIPAVSGYAPPDGADGAQLALDASRREIALAPTDEQLADFNARRRIWMEEQERDLEESKGKALTADGVHIPVWANIGGADDVEAALHYHAEGIGLLRTEFLFLDRRTPPDETEQATRLAELLRPFADLPATVRVLDAGGDKHIPWLDLPHEANPFLGVRGIRLLMAHPEVFNTQARAILRAGGMINARDLRVMIPMIGTVEEAEFSRKTLADAHDELAGENVPHPWPVKFGIMIETPAAALTADELAKKVDFFSIGTNDLIQYVMCAERGETRLSALARSDQPAVLAAIRMTAEAGARHGIEVAICGEMGGDPAAVPTLLALGIHHLSMTPSSIGRAKRAIRTEKR